MLTFGRMSICSVLALLTGCVGCGLPGQPTGTKLGPNEAWFQDKSTCECNYLFQFRDPDKDIQREDDQTSRVRAMLTPTQPGAINAKYTFLVNMDEQHL